MTDNLKEFSSCLEQAEGVADYRFEIAPGIDGHFAVGIDGDSSCKTATVGINPVALKPLLREVRAAAYGSLPAGEPGGPLQSLLSKAELVAAPLVYTAYNRRRAVIIRQLSEALAGLGSHSRADVCCAAWRCILEEQRFVNALQAGSKALKWPEIWEHRHWLARAALALDSQSTAASVSRIPGEMPLPPATDIFRCLLGAASEFSDFRESCDGVTAAPAIAERLLPQSMLGEVLNIEIRAAASAAQRYSRNYAAWTTRRALMAAAASLLQQRKLAVHAASLAGVGSPASSTATGTPLDRLTPISLVSIRASTASTASVAYEASSEASGPAACLRFLIRQLGRESLPSARLLGRHDMSLLNFRAGVLAAAVRCAAATATAARGAGAARSAESAAIRNGCTVLLLAELLVLLPKFEVGDGTGSAALSTEASAATAPGISSRPIRLSLPVDQCTSTSVNALLQWTCLASSSLSTDAAGTGVHDTAGTGSTDAAGTGSTDASLYGSLDAAADHDFARGPAAGDVLLSSAIPIVQALCRQMRAARAVGTVRAHIPLAIPTCETARMGCSVPAPTSRCGCASSFSWSADETQAVLRAADSLARQVCRMLADSYASADGPASTSALVSALKADILSYCDAVCEV